MSKPIKDLITHELQTRYGTQSNAVWVELVGVDGIITNNFRRALRGRHMRLEVVKTSLLRRACANGPLSKLADALEGPAALITGGESAVDIAKLLEEWKPKFPKESFHIRGAVLEGEFLNEAVVQGLHAMPSRADLQGRVVLIITTPGRKLVGTIVSPGRRIVGIVKQIAEKLEKGETVQRVQSAE